MKSTKTYAAIFWKHDQKVSKTEETYVAELKWVYGKAYAQHDSASRDEDLLHRFLNGLMDQKACQQVEFVKDPANIDEALDEIVKYHDSLQSGQLQWDGSNKTFKAQAARVNDIPSNDGDLDSDEEGGEPNQVAHANFMFSRQSRGNGQPNNVGQPPRTKEPQNGPSPISAPVDPIAQMKTIVAAETEKCLNSMKELLAKQGPTMNGNNKAANQNSQTQNGNHHNPCGRWGQGRWNASGQVQCYICQGYGHLAKECQNLKVPWGGGQQALAPSMQGLNAYMWGFVPVQYPVSVPQSAVPQQVPQYGQSNMAPIQQTGLPTAPVGQVGLGMIHTAPAQQQLLN